MNELINGNPSWEAAEEIGLRFLQMHISNGVEKKVDMNAGEVRRSMAFSCGTTACHGGWYAIYSDEHLSEEEGIASYRQGGELMAKDLGFKNQWNLATWGLHNEAIWGSSREKYGWGGNANMFHNAYNFGKPGNQDLTLKDISDHWLKVAGRLHTLQTGATQ